MIRLAVPLRASDCAEHHAVCRKTSVHSLLRERNAVLVNGVAACGIFGKAELMPEFFSCFLKHFDSICDYLGAYPVSGNESNVIFHISFP